MAPSPSPSVTQLLGRMSAGDASAANELLPVLYEELHALASKFMRERPSGTTLQPTALVNEAWLKLVDAQAASGFESRSHFLGVAARAMRSVLVDYARRRGALKRGGAHERVPLEHVVDLFEENGGELLALDEALTRLAEMDPELGRVVELRFFGGLSVEETARATGRSEATIVREWRVARLWLQRELEHPR